MTFFDQRAHVMPVELNERLSEFSYGYGVTREVGAALEAIGVKAAPFMPSLIHEASLGFDVAFDKPGVPLMLQFKLGQSMARFRPSPRPVGLSQAYWRFRVDTAEQNGQYEMLLRAELDGAEVYYVAPKFHDWGTYLSHYERERVVERSLLLKPSAIRGALDAAAEPDGVHKIVYDRRRAWLCSEPRPIEPTQALGVPPLIREKLLADQTPLITKLERIYGGFERRDMVRRAQPENPDSSQRPEVGGPQLEAVRQVLVEPGRQSLERKARHGRYQASSDNEERALAMAVGAEAWAHGAQLIFTSLSA